MIIMICLLYIKRLCAELFYETGNVTHSVMSQCECQDFFCARPEQSSLPLAFKAKRGWDGG